MASLRSQWPDILDPTFRTIYGNEVKQLPTKYADIFNTFTSKKNIEKDSSASGLSRLVQRAENAAITYEDEAQGYDVTYTHLTFSGGTSVSREMWEDDQFSVMQRKPQNLARAMVYTKEQFGADIFNYGFTSGGGGSATFTAGDAVALFSSAHPRTDGGTNQSNTITSDLAEDSLESVLVAMRGTLDDKGQPQLIQPDTLLVPPALEKEAMILLNSTGRVGTANNDVNPYKGKLNLVVWDFLGASNGGSDTAWFVLDKSFHQINWYNRTDHGIEGPFTDFDTKNAKWSVDARWSAGWSGWRGTYGSKGDNS
jgi:phage major head subunit gpT-like protein